MHLLRSLGVHLFRRQIKHVSKKVPKSLSLLWQTLKPCQNVVKSSVPWKLLKSQKINLTFMGNQSKDTWNTFSAGKISTCTDLKKTKTELNEGSLCWLAACHEWSAWTVHVCVTHHMALETRVTFWLRQHTFRARVSLTTAPFSYKPKPSTAQISTLTRLNVGPASRLVPLLAEDSWRIPATLWRERPRLGRLTYTYLD